MMKTLATFALLCCFVAAFVTADNQQQQQQQQQAQPGQKNSFGLNFGFRRIPGLGFAKKIFNGIVDTTKSGLQYLQDRVNGPHRNPLATNFQFGSAAPGGQFQSNGQSNGQSNNNNQPNGK
ncbi:uncharacterized protein LOC141849154 [Brevipalpus obovatus]|uniref:uncharacterized protein LOC141849154 n=1 Tax=Brevipalpus obovatus TaxID=246614 RepID=UPI003D9E5B14